MLLPVDQSYDAIYVHNTATDSDMELYLHIELQTQPLVTSEARNNVYIENVFSTCIKNTDVQRK